MDGTFTDANNDGTIDPFEGTYNADDVTSTTDHKLTFRISGTDAKHFNLVDKATGEIDFTASPNFEVPAEQRYTFTLTAHDPTNATHSIEVILDVVNVNEPAEFTGGKTALDFDENSTGTVETYTANDPDKSTSFKSEYFWGLLGDDAALFDIGRINGRLTFKKAPNYEEREDNAGGTPSDTDGVYDVIVWLLLDGETINDVEGLPDARMRTVAITVDDVNEMPMFTKTTDDNDKVIPTPSEHC